jgi:dipeptidyl-peptidase-4
MHKRLTIDDIYDPERKIDFDGPAFGDVVWIDDTHFILRRTDRTTKHTEWTQVDIVTGAAIPFYSADRMTRALKRIDGMTDENAARLAHLPDYVLNPTRTVTVLNHEGYFYLYEFNSDGVIQLTKTGTCEEFSPDGKFLSFVRDNNLFVWSFERQEEIQYTNDGNEAILNGRLDWVYQEELYGRDRFKGYWWSPDSTKIVFLRFDESQLKPFPVTDHVPIDPNVDVTNYPLAGAANPTVRLGVVDVLGNTTAWLNTSRYDAITPLIVRVGWTPDSQSVVYQVQDREQHWLDLNVSDAMIIHEERPSWVGITGEPKWLKDGSFLWISEETGWAHLFRYSRDGKHRYQITNGSWEVRSLLPVDEERGLVYFAATDENSISTYVCRAPLAGGKIERLTVSEGVHRAFLNPANTHFVDFWSDFHTPTQVRLHASDGTLLRTIDENKIEALQEFQLPRIDFLQVRADDGFPMDAMIFRPSNFDATKRYPVLVYAYGGPHHPQVVNAWGGEKHMWHRMLAENGCIIWICDNRTGSGRGAESTWPLHRRTGQRELQDLEDSIGWLKSQSYVDPERIGLWGWSYGGYLTLYALTHTNTFKMGIAGAAVTDWRNYDSIYTERYMDTPQNNPDGYEKSSVLKAAANLNGKLLLIHGATDDNVHLQNAMQMAYELQKAGKQFELMIYPRTRHAVTDPEQLKHLRTLMTEFIGKHL